MLARYFSVEFGDLSYEKQQDLIAEVKLSLREHCKELGEQAMKQKWYVAPKTWQEAYCRDACVDYSMWSDLDEKGDEFQKYDWEYTLDEYLEKEAENLLYKGFHHLEVEVEIYS